MKKIFAAFGVTVLGICAAPLAQATNWYVGATGNTSKALVENFDTATGSNVYVGYHLRENVGVELGLLDFGTFAVTSGGNELDVSATTLSLSADRRVNDWFSGYGKVVAMQWKIDANVPVLPPGAIDSESGYAYGGVFGVGFDLGDSFRIMVEAGYFAGIDTVDIETGGAGIEIRF